MNDAVISALRARLEEHGVVVLHISQSGEDERTVLVYLHGPAGMAQQQLALHTLAGMAEVHEAQVSPQSPSILRVRLAD
jgi:hypothetical protein